MLRHSYTYEATLADSLKISWQVHDLIGTDKPLDFTRPFLPEQLAQVRALPLSPREKLLLNQIRANSYLHIFAFVEEFILPFITDEARTRMLGGDPVEIRALMAFAEEEAKHIQLFRRFAEEFRAGFHVRCGVLGGSIDVARTVLSHGRLGVGLLVLMLEWMTQAHYIESIKDDQALAPQFKSLLRHHWMEEAQHAKLDTLVVERLAETASIEEALADLGTLVGAIDALLMRQVELDLVSLEEAAARRLDEPDRIRIANVQRRAYRETFLATGLTTRNFLATVDQLAPGAASRMRDLAATLVA